MGGSSKSSLLGVIAGAVLVVAAADVALQQLAPIPARIIEVDDGVRAYEESDPDVFVLGSSHTRSFGPVRDALAKEGVVMTLVPVEWGTFHSYEWVLDHRIKPLLEERDAGGALGRSRLSRAILVTTFFDMCSFGQGGDSSNLPARAWTGSDFLADVVRNGLTDFNRNYLQTRYARALSFSVLVQNHGHDFILDRLSDRMRSPETVRRLREAGIEGARSAMEAEYATCNDAREQAALERMVDYLGGRQVEVTVVLFPLMPSIVSDTSRATTLRRYADWIADLARRKPIRVVDITEGTPLVDDDFQRDRDHVSPEGNKKFAAWSLEHDLAYLREARPTPSRAALPR